MVSLLNLDSIGAGKWVCREMFSVRTHIPPFEVSQFRLNHLASENLIFWIENILVGAWGRGRGVAFGSRLNGFTLNFRPNAAPLQRVAHPGSTCFQWFVVNP